MKKIIWAGLLLCLISLQSESQVNAAHNQFSLNAVYNRFWQNDSTAYLEIATACYPNQIALIKDSNGIHGTIELLIKIKNKADGKIVRADRFHIPITQQDSVHGSSSKSLINKFTYNMDDGSYIIVIYGFDNGNPIHRDSIIMPVEIYRRPKTAALSDIELASNITESHEIKDSFYKNSLRVITNPSLVFGKLNYPVVFHYVEAYNLNKDSLYTVEIVVKDQNGEIKKSISKQKRYGVKDAVEVGTTAILNLSSGKYVYQIRILDGCMKEVVQAQKYFFIDNPQVKLASSSISMKAVEFLGMNADELGNEFRVAKYLATDQEIKTFSKVTNAEGRREFLAKFWFDIENGQNRQTGLTRAIYLDRVLISNQRYHALGKEGWQTDRGRVYLLYAEPDEVQRFPSSNNGKPYEIWNYNQIESGVIFVFIDQTGFGDYRLVHSTKRGELQDESWQQHLQ
jgi:GWxTD domain-containing protein